MRTALRLVALLAIAGWLIGEVKLGQKAPALRLGAVLSGSSQVPAAGHAVVIEFWATWCGPCRAAIPHLNELSSRFRGRGVDFLSLSSEPEKTVREFLREHPIDGTVALDPNHVNGDAFGPLIGLPGTVLIDSSGVLVAITGPDALNAAVLEALLAHKSLPLNSPDARIVRRAPLFPGETINDPDSAARAVVRRVNSAGWTTWTNDRYDSLGTRLQTLLAFVYGIPEFRIELPTYLASGVYSVQAWVPANHPETLKPLLQAAVTAGAGIRVRIEERSADVLVLSGMPGKLRSSSSALSEWKNENGTFSGDCTAEEIRGQLEWVTQKTVVLDHALAGRFTFELRWNLAKSGDLENALQNQLGLELTPSRRIVPFLLVDSLDAASKLEDAAPKKR